MSEELTQEYVIRCRKDADRKYKDELEKFSYQMLAMGFYKIKSVLTEEGLKKVSEVDQKRTEKAFENSFSEKTWEAADEVWANALSQLIPRISNLYGLNLNTDSTMNDDADEDDPKLDFFA